MCYGQGSAKTMNIRNFFQRITCLRLPKEKKQQKTNELIHETYKILNLRKLWLSQTESVLDELRADSGVVQSHSNHMNVFVHTTTLRI